MSTELERARRELELDISNHRTVSALGMLEHFERLVREDERRLTVEACAWSTYYSHPGSQGCCVHCKRYMRVRAELSDPQRHCLDCPIRALLLEREEEKPHE